MSVAERLRALSGEFYLSGTPEGTALEAIIDDIPAAERALLVRFLARLEKTAALSCPAADLTAAIDATLNSA